ncbi:MAG TPA: ABC transporter ATP-binding protein [Acidimicrobiales bacterium]|nr:ABC transporter ATP-binding protein [Acidimicrobiales bacterium]
MKVDLRGITKRFPGVVACSDVDLSVESGEVHALLGENGAGKSTLMNILFGLYRADEGEILLDGEPLEARSPADAIAAGVGMVHQHFMLVPVFTVAENVMLGVEPTSGPIGSLDRAAARQRVVDLSERYGLAVDPDAVVEDLPVGVQQRVEILKALYRDAQCLILDEPTAVLTPTEIDDLMGIIRQLADDGRAVIFISHKLREVVAIADNITVLRGGAVVGSTTPAEADEQALATMMVGHDVQLVVDKGPARPGAPVLEVDALVVDDDRGVRVVDGVSLEVRAGEILAVAGVQGNGQSELVEAIAGLRAPHSGTVHLDGTDVTGSSPRRMFRAGLAHVPEDRQRDGLVASFPIADNLVLDQIVKRPFSRGGRVDRSAVRRHAADLVDEFDVRTPSIDVAASALSGGNQQKVIIAREFFHADRLLVLSQPTRGLDVGSIQYIHRQVVAKRDEGVAVLLNSSELDEVLALADRIAVIYRGRIVGVVDRADANREVIGLLMAGAVAEAAEVEPAAAHEDEVTVT